MAHEENVQAAEGDGRRKEAQRTQELDDSSDERRRFGNPLRREDPAERERGLYDLNVEIGVPWMRPRAREPTRSRDGARPLTGPSRSGDLVNGSMHDAWAGREHNRKRGARARARGFTVGQT